MNGSFQWLNKQGVASSAGFVLQSMHRYFYHYVEGPRLLKVIVEPCRDATTGVYYEEISGASLQAWSQPSGAVLSEHEQVRVRSNVEAALTFMGIEHRFVP